MYNTQNIPFFYFCCNFYSGKAMIMSHDNQRRSISVTIIKLLLGCNTTSTFYYSL